MKLKIWRKKYGLSEIKYWRVNSNVVAVGSGDKAAEAKYYCCSTWLHKQSFEALICFRMMKILEDLTLDDTFTALIGKFRVDDCNWIRTRNHLVR